MPRDLDRRDLDRERHDAARGGRGSSEPARVIGAEPARDALTRDLDLPRGRKRERVRLRNWEGELRGSEVRVLAAAGAFRIVPMDELRHNDRSTTHRKDVERLCQLDLVRTLPCVVGRERTTLVTLTEKGREMLEAARLDRSGKPCQAFYAGIAKARELAHDSRVYGAYLEACERLGVQGVRVHRVVLEQDLKRDYQQFLQAPNRGRRDSSGRPERDPAEIARWARECRLPVIDDHVKFPDLRLECEGPDGRRQIEDVEVMTPHYRGAQGAAKVRAGFTRYRATGARLGGGSGAMRSGRGRDVRLAEEMLP